MRNNFTFPVPFVPPNAHCRLKAPSGQTDDPVENEANTCENGSAGPRQGREAKHMNLKNELNPPWRFGSESVASFVHLYARHACLWVGACLAAVTAVTFIVPTAVAAPAQQAYLKASNAGASDSFGYSVAVSGDTMVVGA